MCWHSLLFFGDEAREMKNDSAIGSEIRLPDLPDLNAEVHGGLACIEIRATCFAHFLRHLGWSLLSQVTDFNWVLE